MAGSQSHLLYVAPLLKQRHVLLISELSQHARAYEFPQTI
uniref:Uncharacterized protein n=1 Tax=Rhizophora mucronata TaxID=61149 RepID=A0A2P2LB97_RHIMU